MTRTHGWTLDNEDLVSEWLPEQHAMQQRLPSEWGTGISTGYSVHNGLQCIETQFAPNRAVSIRSRIDSSEARMVLTLALKGCSHFTDSSGEQVVFQEGNAVITTFNACEGQRHYQAEQSVSQLRYAMSKSWLDRQFGEQAFAAYFKQPATMQLIHQQPISVAAWTLAHSLRHGGVAQRAQALQRQGHAFAIVASELSPLLMATTPQALRFDGKDRDKAEQARAILMTEYKQPPSVDALAKRVGVNQCKLKQLFHYFFDSTPYKILVSIRMKKAYHLLKTQGYTVNQTADSVGYQHASNFSLAFRQYYGYSPKKLLKATG
jgi:AraC family transcriptional activator of pyochelin receptor